MTTGDRAKVLVYRQSGAERGVAFRREEDGSIVAAFSPAVLERVTPGPEYFQALDLARDVAALLKGCKVAEIGGAVRFVGTCDPERWKSLGKGLDKLLYSL